MNSIEHKLPVSDFNGQFLLSQDEKTSCDNWHVQDLNGWTLSHHDSLRFIKVTSNDATGDCIGWFLGWPINNSGVLICGKIIAPFDPPPLDRSNFSGRIRSLGTDHEGDRKGTKAVRG